ncbi:MAG: BcepC6B gp14 [Betaproteobacteria bacterium]|nr:BcepC6B gp14 [Betaproteobacteria bacterium]
MAAAIPYLIIASTVVSAVGAVNAASAQADNSRAQAQAAQTNATIAQQNAHNTLLVSDANEEQQRRKSAMQLGEQRASLLSAGIGADGSASDVIGQSTANAELDAFNIRYQGGLQANNYANQSLMDNAQSGAALQSASNQEEAGTYGAATSLLSGAGKYADYKATH